MLKNYSIESKELLMRKAAQSTEEIIDFFRDYLAEENFDKALSRYNDRITSSVNANAEYSDSNIYVISSDGTTLSSSDKAAPEQFPYSVIVSATSSQSLYLLGDLGVFPEVRSNYLRILYSSDGDLDGIIIVSSASVSENILTSRMTSIIIAASLWIFLAALLSVYNLSKKISEPLNEISEAAKKFSVGDFDVRVKVYGKDEIAELATAFNTMAESLAHLEQMRTTFIANISHDLRTPMTSISGFVDGIIDGTIPPEKHGYYLNIISAEARRLSRLINSILEVSKLESKARKLSPSIYNLSEQTREILISFEQKITTKHIDISFECGSEDLFVYADRDAMHQVTYNILDNAVKFTNENGQITLRLETILQKKRKVRITVRNTGQGISEEDLPYVFERFYKTDRSRGLDKSGMGLGLYIVKAIVTQHGEDIKVNSKSGEYCEFTWTIPFSGENGKRQ